MCYARHLLRSDVPKNPGKKSVLGYWWACSAFLEITFGEKRIKFMSGENRTICYRFGNQIDFWYRFFGYFINNTANRRKSLLIVFFFWISILDMKCARNHVVNIIIIRQTYNINNWNCTFRILKTNKRNINTNIFNNVYAKISSHSRNSYCHFKCIFQAGNLFFFTILFCVSSLCSTNCDVKSAIFVLQMVSSICYTDLSMVEKTLNSRLARQHFVRYCLMHSVRRKLSF